MDKQSTDHKEETLAAMLASFRKEACYHDTFEEDFLRNFISERKPIRLPTLLGNCCSNAWTIICRTFVVGSGSMLPCPS